MDALNQVKSLFLDSLAPYQKHWKTLSLTLLLAWLPLWLVTLTATFLFDVCTSFFLDRMGLGSGIGLLGALIAVIARLGVSLLVELPLFFLACALSQGLAVVQILAIEKGSILSPVDAWRELQPILGKVLVTSTLSALTITLGFCFFLVPGAIAAMYLQLAVPLTILERKSGTEALKESFSLIHRAPRGFLAVLVGTGIVSSIAQILAGVLLPNFLALLGSNLIFMVLYPLEVMVLLALYRDIRTREAAGCSGAEEPLPVV